MCWADVVRGDVWVCVWISSFDIPAQKGYQDISIKVLQKKKVSSFRVSLFSISPPTLSNRKPKKKPLREARKKGKSDWAEKNLDSKSFFFDLKTKVWDKIPTERETYYLCLISRHLSDYVGEEESRRKLRKKKSKKSSVSEWRFFGNDKSSLFKFIISDIVLFLFGGFFYIFILLYSRDYSPKFRHCAYNCI